MKFEMDRANDWAHVEQQLRYATSLWSEDSVDPARIEVLKSYETAAAGVKLFMQQRRGMRPGQITLG